MTAANRSEMSFHDWLAERDPAPPPALGARLNAAVEAAGCGESKALAECALDTGIETLRALLDRDDSTRGAATDLLAADALVTYAFEAAADGAGSLDQMARGAMERIAHLAREGR